MGKGRIEDRVGPDGEEWDGPQTKLVHAPRDSTARGRNHHTAHPTLYVHIHVGGP